MKIHEFHPDTLFEFECDMIIDNMMQAHFDTSDVTVVGDLLKQHGIDFVIRTGLNERHCKIVTIHTTQPIPEAFYYDLTTEQVMWR